MELSRPSRPVDGIVTFDADWKTWTLFFGVNAMCRMEAEIEPDELDLLLKGPGEGEQPSLTTYRAAFWAGLREHHPNLTFEDAGRLMDHTGLNRVGSLVAQALAMALPDVEGGGDRPRKARRRKGGDRA